MTETTQLTTFTPEQRSILLDTTCKGVPTEDFLFMLELAKKYHLDPFARQIFCTKMGIIISRDGYLAVAHQNSNFDGMKTTFVEDSNGDPISCTTTVWRKDWNHPIEETAHWKDYCKDTEVWRKYKHSMLQKCSERMALSRAFCITGVYSDAELDTQVPPTHKLGDLGECIDVDPIIVSPKTAEPMPAPEPQPQPEPAKAAEPVQTAEPIDTGVITPQQPTGKCPVCGAPSMTDAQYFSVMTAVKNTGAKVQIPQELCYECAGKKYKEAIMN